MKLKRGLSKIKRNRAGRDGDDAQYVEDRKKGSDRESRENMRTRGPARDLDNQQLFPTGVVVYCATAL